MAFRDCPGCRGHKAVHDPSHTHDERCRHQFVYNCPGCVKNLPVTSTEHTYGVNCRMPQLLRGTTRRGEPLVPSAVGDPMRPAAPAADSPDAAAHDQLPLPDAADGVPPAAAAAAAPTAPATARRGRAVDAGVQASTDDAEWVAFNLGRAVQLLHHHDIGIVRRTLRRLHIKFWHCPAKRLEELLRHAGAPASALK